MIELSKWELDKLSQLISREINDLKSLPERRGPMRINKDEVDRDIKRLHELRNKINNIKKVEVKNGE